MKVGVKRDPFSIVPVLLKYRREMARRERDLIRQEEEEQKEREERVKQKQQEQNEKQATSAAEEQRREPKQKPSQQQRLSPDELLATWRSEMRHLEVLNESQIQVEKLEQSRKQQTSSTSGQNNVSSEHPIQQRQQQQQHKKEEENKPAQQQSLFSPLFRLPASPVDDIEEETTTIPISVPISQEVTEEQQIPISTISPIEQQQTTTQIQQRAISISPPNITEEDNQQDTISPISRSPPIQQQTQSSFSPPLQQTVTEKPKQSKQPQQRAISPLIQAKQTQILPEIRRQPLQPLPPISSKKLPPTTPLPSTTKPVIEILQPQKQPNIESNSPSPPKQQQRTTNTDLSRDDYLGLSLNDSPIDLSEEEAEEQEQEISEQGEVNPSIFWAQALLGTRNIAAGYTLVKKARNLTTRLTGLPSNISNQASDEAFLRLQEEENSTKVAPEAVAKLVMQWQQRSQQQTQSNDYSKLVVANQKNVWTQVERRSQIEQSEIVSQITESILSELIDQETITLLSNINN